MLGKIEFEMGRRRHEAWLDDNYTWRCDDADLRQVLNDISRPASNVAVVDDTAIKHLLYRVAYRVGGRVSQPTAHARH